MDENLKKKATSGLIWNLAEKLLTQGFSFVIGIVMARLLMPEDYGYVVIATTVIAVAQALVEGGLADALIQRKDADDAHCVSMLIFMMTLAILFGVVIILLAPLIALIYHIKALTLVIRVFAITLPIGAFRTFLMAMMQKQLKFKLTFFSSLSGTIIAGVTGIWMVLNGYEIWALVAYLVIDQLMDAVVMAALLKWKPKARFSFAKVKELYKYAKYKLGWQLVNQYTNQFIDLCIGKKYSSAQLSYYNRGKQYPYLMCNIVNNAIGTTLFPVLSKLNGEQQLKEATRRSIKMVTFIQLPMLFGFAAVAEPLVRLLLTEKWLGCVPFLQITCITYSFWPYLTCYRNAVESIGAVKYTFRNELIITVARILLCGGAIFISPMAVAIAFTIVWILDAAINGYITKRIIGYKFSERIIDVIPNYIGSMVMVVCVVLVGMVIDNVLVKICLQILAGVISYVLFALITRNENISYMLNMLKRKKA